MVVRHPQYGNGVVVERDPYRGIQVDFGYTTVWLSERDIELHTDDTPAIKKEPGPTSSPRVSMALESMSGKVVAARRAILALKLGQVLEENVHELSVGVDEVRAEMERTIRTVARGQPRCILVEGSWGTGKTHLLTMLTRLAAEHQLARATVILDGEGATLSEPMGLMESVLGSLRYPGDVAAHGIGDRLADLRQRYTANLSRSLGRRIAEAISQIPREALEEPEGMEAIEDYFMLTLPATRAREKLRQLGYRTQLPALKAQIRLERPDRFCELLKGWAEFCALTGAKGLVVVFDEVDVEYAAVFRRNPRLLRQLLLRKFNYLLRQRCPILLAFGSAPAGDDVGNTDDAVQDLVRSINEIKRIEAPGPSISSTKELGVRLQELYARAYPSQTTRDKRDDMLTQIERFAERHHNDALQPTPRAFVRGTLELLDVLSV